MAISSKMGIWAVVILAVMWRNVEGQSPMAAPVGAPGPAGPSAECMNSIYNMTDCLGYVTKGSTTSKPDKACCPELAGMLDSNPTCLCQLLATNSKDLPIELDFSRALNLPKVCRIQTPPLSMCSAVGIPVGGPAGAPMTSEGPSPSSVAGIPTSIGGIPASSPGPSSLAGEPTPGKNGASSPYISLVSLITGLAIAFTSSAL